MSARDAAETLKACTEQAQKRCIGTLNNGDCILSHYPCTGACQLEAEAQKRGPYESRPLTDEERDRFQDLRDEELAREREHRARLPAVAGPVFNVTRTTNA